MQIIFRGSKYAVDCVVNDTNVNHALHMTNQGGRFCFVPFSKKPVSFNFGYLAVGKVYLHKIGGKERSATHRATAFFCNQAF